MTEDISSLMSQIPQGNQEDMFILGLYYNSACITYHDMEQDIPYSPFVSGVQIDQLEQVKQLLKKYKLTSVLNPDQLIRWDTQ